MAAKYTPSFAKNVIRRSLRGVLDKHPRDAAIKVLWQHFSDTCAYCGLQLPYGCAEARLDHLIADGPNHISNRAPACGRCNDQEKRDAGWESFLATKATGDVFEHRKKRIMEWTAKAAIGNSPKNPLALAEAEIEAVVSAYENALSTIRRLEGTNA